MREIELKFRVDNLNKILVFLERNGCVVSPVNRQHDRIYVKDLDDVESSAGSVWLRVRKTDEVTELNYKRQNADGAESEEIEFEVSSYEKANAFLKALGFEEWVQVNKERRYSKYKNCNICMDKVEGLGEFVEVEMLVSEQDDVDYKERLFEVAKEIGVETGNIVNSHYDTMIYELRK